MLRTEHEIEAELERCRPHIRASNNRDAETVWDTLRWVLCQSHSKPYDVHVSEEEG
jgi:hypothetical protein